MFMDMRLWDRVEPILDKSLSISDHKLREESIRKVCENEKVKVDVLKLLRAINQADEEGFMET